MEYVDAKSSEFHVSFADIYSTVDSIARQYQTNRVLKTNKATMTTNIDDQFGFIQDKYN